MGNSGGEKLQKDNPEKNESEKDSSGNGKIRKRSILNKKNLKLDNHGKEKSEKGQF